VAQRLRPNYPLGAHASREEMAGLAVYTVGQAVRCLYDGVWGQATVSAAVEHQRAPRPAKAEERGEAAAGEERRRRQATKEAETAREAAEAAAKLRQLAEEAELQEAEARQSAHRKMIARAKQIREETGRSKAHREPSAAERRKVRHHSPFTIPQQQASCAAHRWQAYGV
jgi:hypothetical protein